MRRDGDDWYDVCSKLCRLGTNCSVQCFIVTGAAVMLVGVLMSFVTIWAYLTNGSSIAGGQVGNIALAIAVTVLFFTVFGLTCFCCCANSCFGSRSRSRLPARTRRAAHAPVPLLYRPGQSGYVMAPPPRPIEEEEYDEVDEDEIEDESYGMRYASGRDSSRARVVSGERHTYKGGRGNRH